MGTEGSFPGVTRQGREADHSPPTSAEVKKMWICTRISKKRITYAAGFSMFLNILNTQDNASANCVRVFQKDQQTLNAWATLCPQRCSGIICKRNLFCGYPSCVYVTSLHLALNICYTLQKHGRRKWKIAPEGRKSFVLKETYFSVNDDNARALKYINLRSSAV
jgi:hypothetical protein